MSARGRPVTSLLALLGASAALWITVALPRTRHAPSWVAWLAGREALELALAIQLAVAAYGLGIVVADRGWTVPRWLGSERLKLSLGVLLALVGLTLLGLHPWWGQVALLLATSIFVDAVMSALQRRQAPPPAPTNAEFSFASWAMVAGGCLLLLCPSSTARAATPLAERRLRHPMAGLPRMGVAMALGPVSEAARSFLA